MSKTLYLPEDSDPLPAFRLVYTRLFRISQLGLEGDAAPAIAKAGLDRLIADLVDSEGGRVKNEHLAQLASRAAILVTGFLGGYLLLATMEPDNPVLRALAINRMNASAFMMLWVGCCIGVWVSYAVRTTTFTLKDLTITDADRLQPFTRLVFACILAGTLGLILMLGWGDLKVGQIALADFVSSPTEGFLFGIFCGVSELLLPGIVSRNVSGIFSKLQ